MLKTILVKPSPMIRFTHRDRQGRQRSEWDQAQGGTRRNVSEREHEDLHGGRGPTPKLRLAGQSGRCGSMANPCVWLRSDKTWSLTVEHRRMVGITDDPTEFAVTRFRAVSEFLARDLTFSLFVRIKWSGRVEVHPNSS
jgi:hypothetical protein